MDASSIKRIATDTIINFTKIHLIKKLIRARLGPLVHK